MNSAALVTLLLGLVDRAAAIGTLLNKTRAEGREPSDAEIDAVIGDDAAARQAFQAAIDAAKGGA